MPGVSNDPDKPAGPLSGLHIPPNRFSTRLGQSWDELRRRHRATRSAVRSIPLGRPFVWLARGWGDLRHLGRASLAYGAVVAIIGALIIVILRHPYYIAASIAGFLLVGPILAAGLCELSRLRDQDEAADFDASLASLIRSRSGLLHFAGLMLACGVAWFVISGVILYTALGSTGPGLSATQWGGLLAQVTQTQVLSYAVIGGLLACIVFALSVVSVPMIVDRNTDARTAMHTSFCVVVANLPAMLVWVALIVALVGVGFATFLAGMVLVYPLLGHATWHAYRDLVR